MQTKCYHNRICYCRVFHIPKIIILDISHFSQCLILAGCIEEGRCVTLNSAAHVKFHYSNYSRCYRCLKTVLKPEQQIFDQLPLRRFKSVGSIFVFKKKSLILVKYKRCIRSGIVCLHVFLLYLSLMNWNTWVFNFLESMKCPGKVKY